MKTNPYNSSVILRPKKVQADSGQPASTLYLRISQGLWTRAIKIGPRASGWPAEEVAALNTARIAGKSDKEIRELVLSLEAARNAT